MTRVACALVFLWHFTLLGGSALAQQPANCNPDRLAELINKPSVLEGSKAPTKPAKLSDLSWKVVQELPNTFIPDTPERAHSLGRSTRIFAEFLVAWNPSVTLKEASKAITNELTSQQSIATGLVAPMVDIISVSYERYTPAQAGAIGGILNPAIAEVNPRLARLLCAELGLPMLLPSEAKGRGNWGAIGDDVSASLPFLKEQKGGRDNAIPNLSGLNAVMMGSGFPNLAKGAELPNNLFKLPQGNAAEIRRFCPGSCNWSSVATTLELAPVGALAGPWGLGIAAVAVAVENVNCKLDCDKAAEDATEKELARYKENQKKQQEEAEKKSTEAERKNKEEAQQKIKDKEGKACNPQDKGCPGGDDPQKDIAFGGPKQPAANPVTSPACAFNPDSIECLCEKGEIPCEPLDPNDPRCSLEQPVPGCYMVGSQIERQLTCMRPGANCGGGSTVPKANGEVVVLNKTAPKQNPTTNRSYAAIARQILARDSMKLNLSPEAKLGLQEMLKDPFIGQALNPNEVQALQGRLQP